MVEESARLGPFRIRKFAHIVLELDVQMWAVKHLGNSSLGRKGSSPLTLAIRWGFYTYESEGRSPLTDCLPGRGDRCAYLVIVYQVGLVDCQARVVGRIPTVVAVWSPFCHLGPRYGSATYGVGLPWTCGNGGRGSIELLRSRAYVAPQLALSLMRLACFLGEVTTSPREVETSFIEAMSLLIRLVTTRVRRASGISDLRVRSGLEAIAAAEQRAAEDLALVDLLKVKLEEANRHWASLEVEVENYRVNLAESREQLKEVRLGCRTLEDELLKMTSAMEKLKVELPTEAIAEYKKLAGFEMGLVRTGQVSYEYGYQIALDRFKAQYPDLEIEEDSYTTLLEDGTMAMATEQPFEDSLPPLEE
ncbi:hypothetical protein BHM03_00039921 [Ensete ventricosum]|nr:hypothetical protein BHM03_00039921 [Ensete ventricosum]